MLNYNAHKRMNRSVVKADNNDQLFKYFWYQCGISPQIINDFVKSGVLWQSDEGIAVFPIFDSVCADKIVGAEFIDCNQSGNVTSFTQQIRGMADYSNGFEFPLSSDHDVTIILESVVELLYFYALYKPLLRKMNCLLVSTSGNYADLVSHYAYAYRPSTLIYASLRNPENPTNSIVNMDDEEWQATWWEPMRDYNSWEAQYKQLHKTHFQVCNPSSVPF